MGNTERWEEAIDVDDSDLPSLLHPPPTFSSSSSDLPTLPFSLPPLRPCSQLPCPSRTLAGVAPQLPFPAPDEEEEAEPPRSTSSRRIIPGPAGAVQAAMHRKAAIAVSAAAHQTRSGSCFKGRDDQIDDTIEEDGDFKLNSWLCAMHFLGLGTDSSLLSPISSIRAHRSTIERVPQVVGIVNSCVPNGLGDLFITLKDPTGMIGASIHHNVLSESNLNCDISVGCVLILKQVVVFCPARSAHYLNVTPNNVVKLINKECGPPHKQMLPSLASRCITSGVAKRAPLVRQMAESAADEARGNLSFGRTRNGGSLPCSDSATPVTTTMAANPRKRDLMEVGVGLAERARSVRLGAETTGSLACSSSATTAVTANIPAKPDLRMSEPKKLISKVSVAQWTDEQLSELFADYQDDVELVHPGI